jgi:methionyl aminopeptidase
MEKEIIDKYHIAASAWKKAIAHSRKIKEGTKLLDFAKSIEKIITDEDCGHAFPINLSVNEEAAHFTPEFNSEYKLAETDLLKVDIGVHYQGYICDGAISINLNNDHAKQIEANELALENAISVAEYGKSVDKIGKAIEETLKEKGFNPVYNLGGHGLDKFDIHTWPSLPNHSNGSTATLEEGAIAIEPFASTKDGFVNESSQVEIFSLNEGKNVRNMHARKLLAIAKEFQGLPFAERWLREKSQMSDFQVTVGLKELMKADVFKSYPGLRETKGAMVSQVEKSLLILENKTIVLGE